MKKTQNATPKPTRIFLICLHMLTFFMSIIIILSPTVGITATSTIEEDRSAAIIYAYFRISDTDSDESTLSVDTFNDQITEIKNGGYTLLPLNNAITAIQQDIPLAPKSIAITFDGNDESIFKTAAPLLDKEKIPYTIFISPDQLDKKNQWEKIRELAEKDHVEIGITPYHYNQMTNWSDEKITNEINRAKSRYREELKSEPKFFAYPYGMYNQRVRKIVEKSGFKAAFGQQSGTIHKSADHLYLPRFTMTDDFGDVDRFRLTSNARPLPVKDTTPVDSFISAKNPVIGFTISPQIPSAYIKKILCFGSNIGKLKTEMLGNNRVEIRFDTALEETRLRINCTLPTNNTTAESWRWLGFLLHVSDTKENTAFNSSAALQTAHIQTGIE